MEPEDSTEPDGSRIVRIPTAEEAKAAFGIYATGLGRATYAWNTLMERLGALFVMVLAADRAQLLEVWYVNENDRTKIQMLAGAIGAWPDIRWTSVSPKAKKDLQWLATEATNLVDARNDVVHGPTMLSSTPDGHEMTAHIFSGHRRAANLRRKDLLLELNRVELWADSLSRFTMGAISALHPSGAYPWPDKPQKPDLKRKSGRPNPPPLSDS